jgi:5,10-methylenetetrahydromethanopterin reductase
LDEGARDVAECVRAAEESGFDVAWFADHYFLREVYEVQALSATRTRRILLGAGVTSPYLRHPALLASAVVTLDELSQGRALLGIGAGGHEFQSQLDLIWKRPLTGCREAAEIIRALWRGEEVTYRGEEFSVKGARLPFTTRADIPIYFAARGNKMLKLAGEMGDGVITHSVTGEFAEHASSWVRKGAETAGRDPAAVEIAIQGHLAVTEDVSSALKALKPHCILMAGGEYSLDLVPLYHLTPEEVTPLRRAVREGDFRGASGLVTEKMVRAFCIVGDAEECVGHLRAMAERGIGQFIVSGLAGLGRQETIRLIETTGQKIIARFH